jgi:hypothetical protein
VAEGQTDVSVLLIALRHGVVMAKVHHFPSLLNADTRRSYLTDAYDALFVTVCHRAAFHTSVANICQVRFPAVEFTDCHRYKPAVDVTAHTILLLT